MLLAASVASGVACSKVNDDISEEIWFGEAQAIVWLWGFISILLVPLTVFVLIKNKRLHDGRVPM